MSTTEAEDTSHELPDEPPLPEAPTPPLVTATASALRKLLSVFNLPDLWFVRAFAAAALALVVARVFWDDLHERFDDTAIFLTILAAVAVLLPFVFRALPSVRRVKYGDAEIEFADLKRELSDVTPVRVKAGTEDRIQFPANDEADIRVDPTWRRLRATAKAQTRELFLVHVLKPSTTPGQLFDIFIFLSRPKKPIFDEVAYAEFYFGRYWGHRVFKVKNRGGRIGVATAAYGPFLAYCRITFTDGRVADASRFIDFEMARLYDLPAASRGSSSA